MSETVDVHSSLRVLRRRWRWLIAALLAGALLGGAYAYLSPPGLTSTALVLLPPSTTTANGSPNRQISTEIRIATSTPVLDAAGSSQTPRLPAKTVAERLSVTGPTQDILQFRTTGSNPREAEQLANAAAQSYIDYSLSSNRQQSSALLPELQSRAATLSGQVKSLQNEVAKTTQRLATEAKGSAAATRDSSLLGTLRVEQSGTALLLDQVNASIKDLTDGGTPAATGSSTDNSSTVVAAQLLQPASSASRASKTVWIAEMAVAGALLLTFLASILLIWLDRRDRRPRTRDEIATAIGAPVLGSMPSRPQRNVAGWTELLVTYRPAAVEEWSLRKTLRQLGVAEARGENGASLLILVLDGDLGALALAPQLAIASAASGIATTLVPLNGAPSATSFRAACHRLAGGPARERLRVEGSLEDELQRQQGDFVIFVGVVNVAGPALPDLPGTVTTVLSVSAGRATADELARIAVAADDAGQPLDGVLVADPEADDTSSGRIPASGRPQTALPTRVTGTTSGSRL